MLIGPLHCHQCCLNYPIGQLSFRLTLAKYHHWTEKGGACLWRPPWIRVCDNNIYAAKRQKWRSRDVGKLLLMTSPILMLKNQNGRLCVWPIRMRRTHSALFSRLDLASIRNKWTRLLKSKGFKFLCRFHFWSAKCRSIFMSVHLQCQ